MGMTMAEKILAAHAGLDEVHPGQFIMANVDLVLANDITAPIAIREFHRIGVEKVWDPDRIVLVPDHFTPNKDIPSAQQCRMMREFARAQGIRGYFEVGRAGIEHVLLPEQGLVLPGDLVVGADSHTCTYGALGAFATGMGSTDIAAAMATGQVWLRVPETIRLVYSGELPRWVGGKDLILYTIGQIGVDGARYRALEFTGPTVAQLSMDARFTMANMAIEAGAKAGLFPVDAVTLEYIASRARRPYQVYPSDPDAGYEQVLEYDVRALEPQVAVPPSPANVRPLSQVQGIPIDQVVIGSCTNGRWGDLQVAARLLQGRRVHPEVRCIIIPGTQELFLRAVREGLAEIFVEAGAVFSPPTCGPCLGGHMGVLAEGERCLSTTNRNFVGRMGHPTSEVYLSNPAVAAASAVLGYIGSPDELSPGGEG
ncbi:MAG: 3-isopropylmalate dehydratase large subunit [Anaerolineae bacterium]|nr:3-isopropylmalate dehydratase large subunit [Anaerolineae bacterium]